MIGKKFYKGNFTDDEYYDCSLWCDSNNATIVDKGTYFECVAIAPHVLTTEEQIEQLKTELASYDYIGVKIAMGVATAEEYAEHIAYTETLRNKIRELEGE